MVDDSDEGKKVVLRTKEGGIYKEWRKKNTQYNWL